MYARNLISESVPALQGTETGSEALRRMEVFHVSHLPVVSHGDYGGLISETDITGRPADDPVGTDFAAAFKPFVYEYQHLYEVIELSSRLDLSVVPVLSENDRYLGMIPAAQLMHAFGELVAAKSAGGILVLEVNAADYFLSQIARIVEDNDAKILSCYITSPPDSVKTEITLKINRTDLTSVIRTFIRYEYTVKASFRSRNHHEETLRSHYEQFMMYLNV
ncbi:MAG: CBS domain-containing protein [Bacteroidales bacterium]|jgi:CBS domain-containing protein|nr:CBS domain-containing protein [Bacteroidales bacterium]